MDVRELIREQVREHPEDDSGTIVDRLLKCIKLEDTRGLLFEEVEHAKRTRVRVGGERVAFNAVVEQVGKITLDLPKTSNLLKETLERLGDLEFSPRNDGYKVKWWDAKRLDHLDRENNDAKQEAALALDRHYHREARLLIERTPGAETLREVYEKNGWTIPE